MAEPRTCTSCGAQPKTLDARFCEFCGTELPLPEPSPTIPAGPHGDLPARFAALRRHADLPALMERTPPAGFAMANTGCAVAVMVPFLLLAGGMTVVFAGAAGWMALVPAGMFVFGLVLCLKQLHYASTVTHAPLERLPALVIGERTKISGGENKATRYFVTIQTEDGRRRELKTPDEVIGQVGQGDVGLAYVKHDLLVDFARVAV